MKSEDEESAPRTSSASTSKKKKRLTHVHVGPNARAYSAGRAFCPVCDADKILRMTDTEREAARAANFRTR